MPSSVTNGIDSASSLFVDQGGRSDNLHCECDFGVLVSKAEFKPFRRRENGSNPNLDTNIECGGPHPLAEPW